MSKDVCSYQMSRSETRREIGSIWKQALAIGYMKMKAN